MPMPPECLTRFSKFEPPPEARTAALTAMDPDSAFSGHSTDDLWVFPRRFEHADSFVCSIFINCNYETNPHIENVVCFPGVDFPKLEQPRNDAGHFEAAHVNIRTKIIGQGARDVCDETTSGNTAQPYDHPLHQEGL